MPRRRRPFSPPRRPWAALSRAQRKRRLIEVKNQIRQSRPYFRGLYHTSDALSPGRGWIDMVFVSRKNPRDYYNVTLQTALCEFSEALTDLAWKENPRLPGLQEIRARLARQGAAFSTERAEIDRSYSAGVGLHATVNEPYLSPEAVERFVLAFLDSGEVAYERPELLRWSADEAPMDHFANPVGDDRSEEQWAKDLLARNKALDEADALAQSLPGSLGARAPSSSL